MTELHNRTVQISQYGDTDGLEVVDAPLPQAGQGEVRVRVLASGLEYTDTLIRRHLYPQTAAHRPPFVMRGDNPKPLMSVLGQKRTLKPCRAMSAILLKADIR